MFYPPTCVGLRYGRARACLGVFLGTSGSLASLKCFVRSLALVRTGFPWSAGRAPSRGRPEPRRATPIRRPVGRSAACAVQECLPAARRLRLRPRLSPRLTLGGLALPRKPRVHGGRVTTRLSLLMPAFSLPCAPPPVARRLPRPWEAPLPILKIKIPPLRCPA